MIGYVRVSTAEQADSGLGLEAQERALREAAEREGWDLELIRDAGKSGKVINGGLRSALDQLTAGLADGLVVPKLDRLVRSVAQAADIMETARAQGWNLVVLDLGMDLSTPQGRPPRRNAARRSAGPGSCPPGSPSASSRPGPPVPRSVRSRGS